MYIQINVLFLVVFLYQVYASPLLRKARNKSEQNSTVKTREVTIPNICELPNNKTGFCTVAQNCNVDYVKYDQLMLDQLRCGPSNENKKRPYVCCEPKDIIFIITTHNQSSSASENETEIINSQSCGYQLANRIMGGEETTAGEFPWLARILRVNSEGTSKFTCTGSLISPRVVLTAAHCIASPKLSQLGKLSLVSLGDHETECEFGKSDCMQHQKLVNVSKLIVHPEYADTKNFYNDIGLIVLKEKVEFTNYIGAICLLEERIEPAYYTVSGWGITETGNHSPVKLKTALIPFSWEQCVDRYKTIRITVWRNQLCAGAVKNQDTCQGDSGGPLMITKDDGRWYAAGVVSFGTKCGTEGWPGVYTYMPSYIEWIRSQLRNITS